MLSLFYSKFSHKPQAAAYTGWRLLFYSQQCGPVQVPGLSPNQLVQPASWKDWGDQHVLFRNISQIGRQRKPRPLLSFKNEKTKTNRIQPWYSAQSELMFGKLPDIERSKNIVLSMFIAQNSLCSQSIKRNGY